MTLEQSVVQGKRTTRLQRRYHNAEYKTSTIVSEISAAREHQMCDMP